MFEKVTDIEQRAVCKDNGRILGQLESDIEKFDKIFLVLEEQKLLDDILGLLCDSEAVKEKGQKILVLALPERWIKKSTSVIYRQIMEGEAKELCRLYSIYEFSDRFQIISDETMLYGSLFQLVHTGLLSLRESVAALLY